MDRVSGRVVRRKATDEWGIKAFFLIMVQLFVSSGMPVTNCLADELRSAPDLTGHFLSGETLNTLMVEPVDIPGEVGPITAPGLYIVGDGWSEEKRAIIDPAVVNGGYDYVRLDGVCRSPDSGLDIIMLTRGMSGTVWGDAKNILFVYFDPTQKRFIAADFEARFVDQGCSPVHARSRMQQNERNTRYGVELYDSLKPPAASDRRLAARGVNVEIEKLAERFEAMNRFADIMPYGGREVPVDVAKFDLQVLGENAFWRIVSVSFEETIRTSWGVLLVEDKRRHAWRSIYDVPHEGSSKRYLFRPEFVSLQGDELQLTMCTDCSWWGKFAAFRIDLNTLAYERIP